jgi:hypothetical protein
MAYEAEVRSLLKDVALTGTATIFKRKLLWLMDWKNDYPGAWKALLDQWEQIGEERNSLYGVEVFSTLVVLLKFNPDDKKVESVSNWAKSE